MHIDDAKTRLQHYPSLRWLAKADHLHWQEAEESVRIEATEATPASAAKIFPITVHAGGRVEIPALHVSDYPDEAARQSFCQAEPGEPKAMAMLCNRFYRDSGHTFLYVHYPTEPAKDAVIDFNAGDTALGQGGMLRNTLFNHYRVDSSSNALGNGVTSFIGFPVSAKQADLIQADAALTMANPGFRYHLFNFMRDAVNCAGFAMTRLQHVGVPLEQLSRKSVKRNFDNDHLPDYLLTWPAQLHRDVGRRGAHHEDCSQMEVPLHYNGAIDPHGLCLTQTSDGTLVGEVRSGCGYAEHVRPKGDKFIAYDIKEVADHVLPHVIDEKGAVRDLSTVPPIAPLAATPVNTVRQPFGISR